MGLLFQVSVVVLLVSVLVVSVWGALESRWTRALAGDREQFETWRVVQAARAAKRAQRAVEEPAPDAVRWPSNVICGRFRSTEKGACEGTERHAILPGPPVALRPSDPPDRQTEVGGPTPPMEGPPPEEVFDLEDEEQTQRA